MNSEPPSEESDVNWASLASDRHEFVNSSIQDLLAILRRYDPLEIISKVAVFVLVRHPDSPHYDTPESSEVNLEYLMSLATSQESSEFSEFPSPDVIERIIKLLTQIHLYASAYFSLSTRESSGGVRGTLEEVAASLRMSQMHVRGDGYWSHLRTTTMDLLEPHNSRLASVLGFSCNDFFNVIERAERLFIKGFHEERREMADPYLDLIRPWKKSVLGGEPLAADEQEKFEKFLHDHSDEFFEKKAKFDSAGSPQIFSIDAKTDQERAALSKLSCRLGENSIFRGSNPNFEFWPLNVTLTDEKPILEHKGHYYVFHSPKILRGAYALMSNLLEKVDHRYWEEKFLKARADYLEKETATLLLKALPGATMVTSASYNLPETGQRPETDIVVAFDDFLLIVECKSATLSAGARRGRVDKTETSLKRTIIGGLNQAERLVRELERAGSLTLKSRKGGRELTLHAEDFRWVIRMNVTLELMGSISTSSATLAEGGMIDSPGRCWSVAINDLRVIVGILDSPISFLHYLVRRLDIHDLGNVRAHDELDFLMHYIRHGLFFRESNQPGPNQNLMLSGFTKELDDYFHRLEGIRHSGKRPRVRWGKGTKRILELLSAQRPRHWLTACIELLEIDSPDREALAANISDHLKRLRDQSSAYAFSFVANFESRKGVGIATSNDPPRAKELIVGRMAQRCMEENLEEVIVILLGVPVSLSRASILFTRPDSKISNRGARLLSQLQFKTTAHRKTNSGLPQRPA